MLLGQGASTTPTGTTTVVIGKTKVDMALGTARGSAHEKLLKFSCLANLSCQLYLLYCRLEITVSVGRF